VSEVITFHTPGTGLPDFEARIALGLAAAALNAVSPSAVTLAESNDHFVLTIRADDGERRLAKSLAWMCVNKLGDEEALRRLPGAHVKSVPGQARSIVGFGRQLAADPRLSHYAQRFAPVPRRGSHDFACGHSNKIFSALLVFSPYIGRPPKRNNWTGVNNLPVCGHCAVLALLGVKVFQIDIPIKGTKERFFALPQFSHSVSGDMLARYLAAAKTVWGGLDDIPADACMLALAVKSPSLLESSCGAFQCSRYEPAKAAARYGTLGEQKTVAAFRFLARSAFCRALVQAVCRNDKRTELMRHLAAAIQHSDARAAADFCRVYGTANGAWPFMHEDVTMYLAGKEVCNVNPRLLDREGDDFNAIRQVADMLKHFVAKQNFGFVDNIRKARTLGDFARILADAQREAESLVLRTKRRDPVPPFVPSQETMRRVLELANDDVQRQDIQTLLAILAFTYYRKEEQ